MRTKLFDLIIITAIILIAIITFARGARPQDSAAPTGQSNPPGLFNPVETTDLAAQDVSPPVLRQQTVTVDFAQLGGSGGLLTAAEAGRTLHLNLFEDVSLTTTLERVEPNATGGGYVWIGKIEDSPFSLVNLVVKDGLLAGDIQQPGEIYQVRPAGEGQHIIRQFDPAAQPNLGDDAVPPPEGSENKQQPTLTPQDLEALAADGSVIDLMVAYTAAARAQAGGTAQILLQIDAAVAYTNQVFTNSNIDTQLRVVHTVEVNYTETNDRNTDLDRLRDPTDGYLDDLHTLRDMYFADLVTLWATYNDPYYAFGIAGLLNTLNPVTGAMNAGFNVLHVGQILGGGHVMAHEVGHNLGAHHDWYISDGATLDGLFTANKGYVNLSRQFKTIMAYDDRCLIAGFNCFNIPFFSNPDLTVNGARIGVEAGTNTTCTAGNLNNPDCDADNHLVLDNAAWTVANFREPSSLSASLLAQPSTVQTSTTSIDYTLIVNNTGSQQLTGVQVVQTLPTQSTFDGNVNQGGTHTNGKITWSGLTLDPFARLELTVRVAIAPGTLSSGDLVVNTVEASTTEGVTLPTTSFSNVVDPQTIYLPLTLKEYTGSGEVPACTPDPSGDSGDIADALTICPGQSAVGQIVGSDFVDVYKISLIGNQLMDINLAGSGAGDADIYLYRPETSSVFSDFYTEAAATSGNNERIKTTTRYGGDWYVAVWNSTSDPVDYSLTVTVSAPKE